MTIESSRSIARPYSVAWTGDGRRLVYQALNPAGIEFRSVDVETGESKAVLEPKHTEQVFESGQSLECDEMLHND